MNNRDILERAILLTLAFFFVEIIGGFISGSLSLMGDAVHMLRDVLALAISLTAVNVARNLPNQTKTFGYHRVEIFAALLNALVLIGITAWIFYEAYQRIFHPAPIQTPLMFLVALVGLGINLYVAYLMKESKDLNMKSALLHVLTDTFASFGVILASVLIYVTGKTIIDPIVGIIIAAIILGSSLLIIEEALRILLQFTPRGILIEDVISDIQSCKGVRGVHHVQLWSLCSNIHVLTAHVLISCKSVTSLDALKQKIKEKLQDRHIHQATLEFEAKECRHHHLLETIRD